MYRALLTRLESDKFQTLGLFQVFKGNQLIFHCKSLELPWNQNKKRISCIPVGEYLCDFRTIGKYANKSFHVKSPNYDEVHGRSHILIHSGNYKKDTLGCILLGQDFVDINGDGLLDITNSGNTLGTLIDLTKEFKLKITSL